MLRFQIDGFAYLTGALAALLLPLDWLLAALFAAAFHEGCHLMALWLMHGKALYISVGSAGTVICTEPLTMGTEALCALAGPVGSLCLLLFTRWIPRTALCAAVQGVFNLLPLYPLDGGRVLRCTLEQITDPHRAAAAAHMVEITCIILIMTAGTIFTVVCKLGLFPLLAAGFLTLRAISRKIPCKEAELAVQ